MTPVVRPVPAQRASLVVQKPRAKIEALWGELEALVRTEERVRFQCPVCARFVDGEATQCKCGAIFDDLRDPIGYECPVCGKRVASDQRSCRCGARFSD